MNDSAGEVFVKGSTKELRRPGQPGGRRDTNRRERVETLLSAALPLFLERGIEEVTIDDITRAAGMAKGGFYRYFADKSALVETMFAPLAEEIEAAMTSCGAALAKATSSEAMLSAYQDFGRQVAAVLLPRTDLLRLYLQESRSPAIGARKAVRALADQVAQHALEMTRQAHTHGLLRPIPPQLSAVAVVGAIEHLLFVLLSGRYEGDPLELPGALISMVLDGLRPRTTD